VIGAVCGLSSPAQAAPRLSPAPAPGSPDGSSRISPRSLLKKPAGATSLQGYQLANLWAGGCLDNNSVDVYLLTCGDNLRNQRWWDGTPNNSAIWSYYGNKCLDGNGGDDVYVLPCNGNNLQKWQFIRVDQVWQIRHIYSNRCLDTNGTAVYKLPCDATNPRQLWQ
jgi:hypothetical protein